MAYLWDLCVPKNLEFGKQIMCFWGNSVIFGDFILFLGKCLGRRFCVVIFRKG